MMKIFKQMLIYLAMLILLYASSHFFIFIDATMFEFSLIWISIFWLLFCLILMFVKVIQKKRFPRVVLKFGTLPFTLIFFLEISPLPLGSYFKFFDSKIWKNELVESVEKPSQRRLMLGSLYWLHLTSITEKEVLNLLGESSEDVELISSSTGQLKVISYKVDREDSLIPFDFILLSLYFNEEGELVDKRVFR